MHEQHDLQRVDPTYHLVFEDGSQLVLTSDMASMQEQLESIQPGGFQGLKAYLQEGERHYQLVLEKMVNCDFRRATDFFNLGNLGLIFRIKPLINHYRNMSACFDNPHLKSAFAFQDLCTRLSPFEPPATYSREMGNKLGIAYSLGNLANITREQGDFSAAHLLFAESLTLCMELTDKLGIAVLLLAMAEMAVADDLTRAACLAAATETLLSSINSVLQPIR